MAGRIAEQKISEQNQDRVPYPGFSLDQTTVNADRHRVFRRRIKAVEELKAHLDLPDAQEKFWEALIEFQDYPFKTSGLQVKMYLDDCALIIRGTEVMRMAGMTSKSFRPKRNTTLPIFTDMK